MGTIGTRVRDERNRLDLTQTELARQLTKKGVKSGTSNVSMIETGDVTPPLPTAVALADVFGVSLDWLTGRAEDRTPCWDAPERIVTVVEPDRKFLTQRWIDFLQTLPYDVMNMWLDSLVAMRQELGRHK